MNNGCDLETAVAAANAVTYVLARALSEDLDDLALRLRCGHLQRAR